MDQRLEQALNFSNFRLILSTKQKNLKILLNNKLKVSYQGGLFNIDQTLITYLYQLNEMNVSKCILMDLNGIPILITDIKDMLEIIIDKYNKALESYYKNYQRLEEARDIRKVVDWDE